MATTMDAILKIAVKGEGFKTAENGIKAIEKAGEGAAKSLGGIGNVLGNLTGGLLALGAGITAAGLVGFAKASLDAADGMRDLSQKTGVSVETLSKFQQAANKSGTDLDSVGAAMVKLSKNMMEAARTGKGPAAEAFKTLGISATDAKGNMKGVDQVMLQVADKFQKIPDGAEKASLAVAMFGKAGAGLIPMLNEGRNAVEGLNATMTTEFAKKADNFNDSIEGVKASFGRMGMAIADQLLPYMSRAVEFIGKMALGIERFFIQNKGAITSAIDMIDGAAKALGPWVTGIMLVVGAYKVMQETIKAVAVAQAVLSALEGPAGLAKLAIGLGLGAAAGITLKNILGEINTKIQAAKVSVDTLPPAIDDTQSELDKLKAQQEAYNAAIQQSKNQYDILKATIESTSQAIQGQAKLTAAHYNAEIAINNAAKTLLGNELQQAKTKEEKIRLTQAIMELELSNAKLQMEAANAEIMSQVRIADLKRQTAWQELRSAEAAILTAKAHGQITGQLEQQLALQKIAANNADREFILAQKIAAEQQRANQANYNAMVAQVKFNAQTQIKSYTNTATNNTQNASNNIVPTGNGFTASNRSSSFYGGTTTGYSSFYGTIGSGSDVQSGGGLLQAFMSTSARRRGQISLFASGGYITEPTLGLIGEGGEREYIVPESRMARASAAYLAGARGPAVLSPTGTTGNERAQINIQTGPVMEFNGERYVKLEDLERAMRATADGVISKLRTPAARIALGMR